MSNIRSLLGQTIRRIREGAALSRFALAEQLQVDPSTVQSWENGTRWPGSEHLEKYCEIFSIRPWALFAAPEEIPSPSPREAVRVLEEFVSKILAPRPLTIREASGWKAAEPNEHEPPLANVPPKVRALLAQISAENEDTWELISTAAITLGKAKPPVKSRT